jgi:hypothetical protein
LWHTNGLPVNIGRAQHIVPDRTRRLVLDRDRVCLRPGCNTATHLEVHHLHHWTKGGTTDTWNLGALCPRDHDAHHRGEFTITGNHDNPGDLKFFDRHGRQIPGVAKPTPPNTPPPAPPPCKKYLHPTGERFDTRWLQFTQAPVP